MNALRNWGGCVSFFSTRDRDPGPQLKRKNPNQWLGFSIREGGGSLAALRAADLNGGAYSVIPIRFADSGIFYVAS